MFTPEAAHKINAACKGSSVTPLDSENQRVFDDVFDHSVNGDFYTVELASGKGFSYPTRNIERVRSAWQKENKLAYEETLEGAYLDSLHPQEDDLDSDDDLGDDLDLDFSELADALGVDILVIDMRQ